MCRKSGDGTEASSYEIPQNTAVCIIFGDNHTSTHGFSEALEREAGHQSRCLTYGTGR